MMRTGWAKMDRNLLSQPKPVTGADYATFHTVQTRWQDNDAYGHMNNVAHFSLFETVVNGWLIQQRLLDLRKDEISPLEV